jgi:hypothetical protein
VLIPTSGPNSFAPGSTLAFAFEANGTIGGVTYQGFSGIFDSATQASSSVGVPNLNNGLYHGSFTIAPVPEPSTLALAGLGGAALLLFRRKKV